MVHPILPVVVALTYTLAPRVDLNCENKDPIAFLKSHPGAIIIADPHGGEDPHGDDPHGGDPNDENHDKGMPAYREHKKYKATKDVYGREVPNSREPYLE